MIVDVGPNLKELLESAPALAFAWFGARFLFGWFAAAIGFKL